MSHERHPLLHNTDHLFSDGLALIHGTCEAFSRVSGHEETLGAICDKLLYQGSDARQMQISTLGEWRYDGGNHTSEQWR